MANDTDVLSDTVTIGATGAVVSGTVSVAGDKLSLTYDPAGEFEFLAVGASTEINFTYDAVDEDGGSATATVTVTVNGVNDAPVLAAASPTLPSINEDETGNSGNLVSAIVGSSISDVDTGALKGMAIIGLTSGTGTWQYSINGGANWTNMGTVNDGSSLLLRSQDLVRLVPDGLNGTSASITYRAWDQTSGTVGTKVSTASRGVATAFSLATDTASITVTAVNDAPTAANKTVTTDEDTDRVFAVTDFNFSDVDTGDSLSRVQITTLPSAGVLYVDSTNLGTVDVGEEVILNGEVQVAAISGGQLKFKPVSNGNGASYATFGFKVRDGMVYSTAAYLMTIDVTAVNDAPTAANKTVTTDEDTDRVFAVTDFNFSDVDTGDRLSRVQITTLPSAGVLYVDSTNLGTVDVGEEVILNGEVQVAAISGGQLKFKPVSNGNGASYATFGFKVRDGMVYSTAAYLMTIDVTAVNDAPVLAAVSPTLPSINEDETGNSGNLVSAIVGSSISDVDTGALKGMAIIGLTSGTGTWQYSINGGANWTNHGDSNDGSSLLLRSQDLVRLVPDGLNGTSASITYRAWDQTSGTVGTKVSTASRGVATAFSLATDTASITVTAVNDAPTAANKTVTTMKTPTESLL